MGNAQSENEIDEDELQMLIEDTDLKILEVK